MTRLLFWWKTGRWPKDDDLDRVNCPRVGEIAHGSCGWCDIHDRPRYQCGCRAANDWRTKACA